MGFGKGAASAGLAAALAAASFLWWMQDRPPPIRQSSALPAPSDPVVTIAGADFEPTAGQLANEIEAAQKAVVDQIGHPPLSGPIEERPAFVSDLEWRVFEGVAHTHADPPQELTLLVNRLRFTRLESLWRSLRPAGSSADLRHRLARQLLDEIPGRVRAGQFDLAQAQTLQQQLLDDLVSEPRERLRRASEESLRLSRSAFVQ